MDKRLTKDKAIEFFKKSAFSKERIETVKTVKDGVLVITGSNPVLLTCNSYLVKADGSIIPTPPYLIR